MYRHQYKRTGSNRASTMMFWWLRYWWKCVAWIGIGFEFMCVSVVGSQHQSIFADLGSITSFNLCVKIFIYSVSFHIISIFSTANFIKRQPTTRMCMAVKNDRFWINWFEWFKKFSILKFILIYIRVYVPFLFSTSHLVFKKVDGTK